MSVFVLLFLGGGLGTLLRYGVSQWLGGTLGTGFPFGTLGVNLLGCFVIGMVFVFAESAQGLREPHRIAIMVGVLGGFTTFSSFGIETVQLITDGMYSKAAGYVAASNVGGIALAAIGVRLGHMLQHGGAA